MFSASRLSVLVGHWHDAGPDLLRYGQQLIPFERGAVRGLLDVLRYGFTVASPCGQQPCLDFSSALIPQEVIEHASGANVLRGGFHGSFEQAPA